MLSQIPNGLDEIIAFYGSLDTPSFEAQNIVEFTLPYALTYEGVQVTHSRCHTLAVDNFIQAFTNIAGAGLEDQFMEYNGIYAARPIRAYPAYPSLHSWGVAIDMGASTHPLGSTATWPDEILRIMEDAGFEWGGDFKSRKDPMHFQLATGY